MFLGYCKDKSKLPVKPGMTVRIKKGTPVRKTTPGQAGVKPAGKTYTVKAHHILCGQSCALGDVTPDGKFYWRVRDKDLYGIMERLDIDYKGGQFQAAAELLKEEALKNLVPLHPDRPDGTKEAVLHIENPMVRWAGPGGYWAEVDVNLVEVVNS